MFLAWPDYRQKQAGLWVKRRFRLTRSIDFKRVRRLGKSYAHPLVVLVTLPNELQVFRAGFVINHFVGGAVVRNRIRRRLRSIVDGLLISLAPGWDAVFVVRRLAEGAGFSELQAAVAALLLQAGLMA